MKKMSIRKDDLVVVLSGKDKGKQGKVLEVLPKDGKRPGRHPAQGGPPLRLQGAAGVPQVQQAHPARAQVAGRRQEGPRLQEVRRRDLREEE